MNTTITCQELHSRLASGEPLLIIDILPPEVFAARHIPGSCNACVYEIVFLDGVATLAPNPATPLVLYDATGTTMATPAARDKLLAAGYRDVRILSGGLAGWLAAGYPVEGVPSQPEPTLQDGRYRLDPAASVLEWIGRNINNRHFGRIPFRGGDLVIAAGELTGEMVLEMGGISDLDLQDETYRAMLVSHLKSADFFDVSRYPLATIAIRGWQPIPSATPGTPDHTVRGDLTIKEITRQVAFPVTLAPQVDGSIKAQAALAIDRTDWNISYGSGKLFEQLGMHLVHDRIDIELFIVARPSG